MIFLSVGVDLMEGEYIFLESSSLPMVTSCSW